MGRDKTKYIPFGVYEYEYMEAWLEDLARKGWILKSMYACFATFEESEPKELRYRIVPNAAFKAEDEEIAFYEENGWHFADCSRGLNVFYCEDPQIPELFTDTRSFSKRARNFAIGSGAAVLAFAYLLWRNVSNGWEIFDEGILHQIHEMGALTFLSLSVLIILAVFVSIWCMIKYARHAKRIAFGQKIEKRDAFHWLAAVNKAWMSVALACVAGMIIGWAMTAISYNDVPEVQNKNHPASLEQVDPEFSSAIDTVLTMQAEGHWPDSYDYWVTPKKTVLFSEYKEVYAEFSDSDISDTGALQIRNDPEETPILSEERYYWGMYAKARSEKIAARYLEENKRSINKDDLVEKFGSDEKSISAEGFDTVDYLHTYDIGYQYLFLRKGKEIEYICYLGPENLEDHIEEIIGDLSN
ncbi:MAG: DUF2812 domain-containing protein [Firmicutes bacterium]|nr:DUF2812 domain-containing protein [Bacillota bacterium]